MASYKLFMVLLGCKPPGRHTEQHDIFFGIAESLAQLSPFIREFWPEPEQIHLDAWREVTAVEDYQVIIKPRIFGAKSQAQGIKKLFFINLGGYQESKFAEQHYTLLTVKDDRTQAFKEAKETLFFKTNHFEGASSHIDDKYGIDVDDLYEIEDILPESQRIHFEIELLHSSQIREDQVFLGYFKLSDLK